jgi:hypothetical protein
MSSNNEIPLFTTGNMGLASTPFTPNNNTIYISSYTGDVLPGRPTFQTKTDDSTGKNQTYHGGIFIGNDIVMCHYKN